MRTLRSIIIYQRKYGIIDHSMSRAQRRFHIIRALQYGVWIDGLRRAA